MEIIVDGLNVRFGTMQDEGKPPLHWAKIGIVEDTSTSRDGFAGVSPAEIRLKTDDTNALAKRLHNDVVTKDLFPCKIKLTCETAVKKGEIQLLAVNYTFIAS